MWNVVSVLLDSGRLSALWTFCGEFMVFKSILSSEFQLLQMATFQSATHPSLFQRLSRPEELFKLKEVKINFSSFASSQHLEFSRGNASFLTLWRWRGGGGGNTGWGGWAMFFWSLKMVPLVPKAWTGSSLLENCPSPWNPGEMRRLKENPRVRFLSV